MYITGVYIYITVAVIAVLLFMLGNTCIETLTHGWRITVICLSVCLSVCLSYWILLFNLKTKDANFADVCNAALHNYTDIHGLES